jgi:hypothetical protein
MLHAGRKVEVTSKSPTCSLPFSLPPSFLHPFTFFLPSSLFATPCLSPMQDFFEEVFVYLTTLPLSNLWQDELSAGAQVDG